MARRLRGYGRAVLALAVVAALLLGGYLGWVALRRSQPVTLPSPGGSYRVGRAAFEWTDPTRTDPLAPRPGTPRRLSVWLWFPAPKFAIETRLPYAPDAWAGLHLGGVPGFFEGRFDAVRGHSLQDATVADGSFPIVVLLPGMGFSAPQYSVLAEDLASRGYLVAGVTPTYSANLTVLGSRPVRSTKAGNPSDLGGHSAAAVADANRLVDLWAADAGFVARSVAGLGRTGQYGGRVAAGRIVYVGHSFGGAASLQACATDARCAGAVDLDGTPYGSVVRTGVRVPALILGAQDSCVTGACRPDGADDRADVATTRSLVAASAGPVRCFAIDGARHFNFSDYGALYLAAPLRRLLPLGSIDRARSLAVQGAYVSALLDQAVRGTPQPLLDGRTRPYPEVHAGPACGS